ncbi:gamma-interferon-inducible lysosomal thiol reductase-like [Pollicipes pollicipes]|uniref:gamma-interferon-inducible lysosomal thiol reductase-like n=1 Tax=Pollicipes pollicipes TaxID=41117 RepID=UPI0018855445|nr:gamma-interferon-inducible lysosomal thiol reductase-like [Pollicipes pollicipes]
MLLPLAILLATVGPAPAQTPPAPPLDVVVYYEALCPDSRHFVVEQLAPAWRRVGAAVLAPSFVPWGKATANATDAGPSVTCQHGPEECWGNRLHACVIYDTRTTDARLEAVTCLMADYETLNATAPGCVRAAGLDWETVSRCAVSDVSLEKELEFGRRTQALQPPLTSVPTITLDGSQDGQAAMLADLLFYVCETWARKTGHTPEGCGPR